MEQFERSHSRQLHGKVHVWDVERLWELAAALEPRWIPVDDIPEVDEDYWFTKTSKPTLRNVVRHMRRIFEAELSYPIILNWDGTIMDGVHRVARAMLEGRELILAVQFATMPAADLVYDLPFGAKV